MKIPGLEEKLEAEGRKDEVGYVCVCLCVFVSVYGKRELNVLLGVNVNVKAAMREASPLPVFMNCCNIFYVVNIKRQGH